MNEIVFFDIDGTLWDDHMQVPDSTAEAIKKLRENGNYAFICSGRSKASIRSKELLDIGFDGMIAGCGTYIEYKEQEIFQKKVSYPEINNILDILKENHTPVILEGEKCLYADMKTFGNDSYVSYLKQLLGKDFRPLAECNEQSNINKMSADCSRAEQEKLRQALEGQWELLFHEGAIVEIVPKGFSKAAGIKRVCEHLGILHSSTYAFGDSVNDIEMLQYVNTGIAMGNATPDAKKAADFVTRPLKEDGIRWGLEHYGLI